MLQKSPIRNYWISASEPWQQIDWLLFLLPVGLTVFGGIMIRSTQLNLGLNDWWPHWFVGGIGLALAVLLARWRYQILMRWQWTIYALTNLLNLAVIFIGTTSGGAQRWITVAGFNVQPSEFAKLGLIITLAGILQAKTADTIGTLLKTLGVAAIPWALVFLQPDLGTSLVFGAIALGMLYWSNTNPGWLVLLISPIVSIVLFNLYLTGWFIWAAIIILIAWFTLPWPQWGALGALSGNVLAGEFGQLLWESLLKDYQKDRLILFLNPEQDPLGGGYHLIQSRIAIGAGQLWGQGLHQGTQTQLNFIPEQHTDFIFSAVGEEFGFVGCIVVLFVFWSICLRMAFVAHNASDNFGSLLAIGVLTMIVFQMLVNIGMTIGLAPVTGIPLPWMSYGRSALLTNFIAIGLVESVANHRQRTSLFAGHQRKHQR